MARKKLPAPTQFSTRAIVKLNTPARINALRQALPLAEYLRCLNQAALSGSLPVYDPLTGRAIPNQTVKLHANQRLETLKYMVDKVMPSKTAVTLEADITAAAHQQSPRTLAANLATLSTEDIARMPGAQLTETLTRLVTPIKMAADEEDDEPVVIDFTQPTL